MSFLRSVGHIYHATRDGRVKPILVRNSVVSGLQLLLEAYPQKGRLILTYMYSLFEFQGARFKILTLNTCKRVFLLF